MARKFGFECELTSGANAVMAALYREDLAGMGNLHRYHCDCSDCRHNDVAENGGYLFRGQEDCTVDGEIISSVLTHGSEHADRAFESLARVLFNQRAGVNTEAGFHVHVDKRDLQPVDKLRLCRMFLRYQNDDLAELASARENNVRSYNSKTTINYFIPGQSGGGIWHEASQTWLYRDSRPQNVRTCGRVEWREGTVPACCIYCRHDAESGYLSRNAQTIALAQAEWDRLYAAPEPASTLTPAQRFWTDDSFVVGDSPKGTWLNTYGAGNGDKTMEFRLWNATRVEWRMRLSVGVSVAMVDAAKAGVNVTENDPRTLEEVLDPFLSDDTWASIIRQRSFKDVA